MINVPSRARSQSGSPRADKPAVCGSRLNPGVAVRRVGPTVVVPDSAAIQAAALPRGFPASSPEAGRCPCPDGCDLHLQPPCNRRGTRARVPTRPCGLPRACSSSSAGFLYCERHSGASVRADRVASSIAEAAPREHRDRAARWPVELPCLAGAIPGPRDRGVGESPRACLRNAMRSCFATPRCSRPLMRAYSGS